MYPYTVQRISFGTAVAWYGPPRGTSAILAAIAAARSRCLTIWLFGKAGASPPFPAHRSVQRINFAARIAHQPPTPRKGAL